MCLSSKGFMKKKNKSMTLQYFYSCSSSLHGKICYSFMAFFQSTLLHSFLFLAHFGSPVFDDFKGLFCNLKYWLIIIIVLASTEILGKMILKCK